MRILGLTLACLWSLQHAQRPASSDGSRGIHNGVPRKSTSAAAGSHSVPDAKQSTGRNPYRASKSRKAFARLLGAITLPAAFNTRSPSESLFGNDARLGYRVGRIAASSLTEALESHWRKLEEEESQMGSDVLVPPQYSFTEALENPWRKLEKPESFTEALENHWHELDKSQRVNDVLVPQNFDGLNRILQPINFWMLEDGVSQYMDRDLFRVLCKSSLKSYQEDDPKAFASQMSEFADGNCALELRAKEKTFQLPGALRPRLHTLTYKVGGLGAKVWTAAVALSIWLARRPSLVCGRKVLELGSGLGLPGITTSLLGAKTVTLSDLDVEHGVKSARTSGRRLGLLENLDANARLNGVAERTSTMPLNWYDCEVDENDVSEKYQVVIGSDLIYRQDLAPALAATLRKHTAQDGIAYLMLMKARAGSESLFSLLVDWGRLHIEDVTVVNDLTVVKQQWSDQFQLLTWVPDAARP